MRAWAHTVLERPLDHLRDEYAARKKRKVFDELAPYLTSPGPPAAEVGARLGLSPGATKVALHRVRKRFGERLRAEVAQTVVDPEDTTSELASLREALRRL